jgi:hypothetical protein
MSTGRPVPHHQLEDLARELDSATAQLRSLTDRVTDEAFHRRPNSQGWSAAECVAHLNLTTQEMLPQIDQAIIESSASTRSSARRYRGDLIGWFLSRTLEPPVKQKFKTTPAFVPTSAGPKDQILREFSEFQGQLVQRLNKVSGLDMQRVKVTSAFNRKIRYNLYSSFRIITAHQRRHLYQAEMALSS